MSATAFQRHGISTTIVEIDPAVYNAARTFFGFTDPGPDKVFLEDARSWVATKRASIQAGNREMRYDFVVHDCFSGGGVPEQLFTLEFWEDLKTILRPDGVVVVVRDPAIYPRTRLIDYSGTIRILLDFPSQILRKWYFLPSRRTLANAEDFMIFSKVCRRINTRLSF